jgi:hypothetical protein
MDDRLKSQLAQRLARHLDVDDVVAAALISAGYDTPHKVRVATKTELRKAVGTAAANKAKARFETGG